MTDDTYRALRAYLERLGAAEYRVHLARKRRRKSDRFSPSPYHRALIAHLNAGDEEGFKALKALQGYASALGV